MDFAELKSSLQNLTNVKIKKTDIADCLGYALPNYIRREKEKTMLTTEELEKISETFGVSLEELKAKEILKPQNGAVRVTYKPDVYLSAGYGLEVYNENSESIILDSKLFVSDRGIKINPADCEIVTISGNSMSPEYRHGDRVIIDKSITSWIDGHIFAFRYNGECFIKEICLLGQRVKAIPLNKEYEAFFIEPNEDVTIFGRILPRVRL